MEIRVLGPLEVSDGGRRVEIGARMPRVILATLIVEIGRVVPVDRLMEALWPSAPPPPTAATALQGYIASLRRALEPDRPPRAPSRFVVAQPPGYRLQIEPDAIDAARFEASFATGRAHLLAQRHDQARTALQHALAEWRGPPYADLASEAFLQPEIARLNELRAAATEDLLGATLALGDHATALPELERLTAADPLRERRWELLVRALAGAGRPAEALDAAARARATLGELGIEPGPSLRRLEHDIRRPAAVVPEENALVGRHDELAALDASLEEALAARGQVVLVSGEPGIGKTRLVEAMAARASARSFAVAWGRCVEGDTPAFWPWSQVAQALATHAALGPEAQVLAQVGHPGVPHIHDVETAQLRLYDAVTSVLVRVAAERPLLVVVDDLQWADVPSIRLLQYLAGRIASTRLALVTTYRDAEVGLDHPLTPTLAALARLPACSRVPLAGLADTEVAQLAGGGIDPQLIEVLHRRTEGNPFFVVELLRFLADGGAEGTIPAGVRDVVRHRSSRLSDDAGAFLAVAAVAGRDFDLHVVAHAAGPMDEDTAIERVEEALAANLVIEDPDRPGALRFSHDLVRQTLYDQLNAVRRARLHRRVGQALAAVGLTSAAVVADHFWRGVPAGAADQAFSSAVLAAEQDLASLAFEQAEQHLRRALSLLDRLAAGPERDRRELAAQQALGLVLLLTRGYSAPEVGETVARSVELSRRVGDDEATLVSTWRLLSFHIVRAEYEPTRTLATTLLDHPAAASQPVFGVTGHRALGAVCFSQGDLAQARHHLERAIALAGGGDQANPGGVFEVHPTAFAQNFLAWVLWLQGEPDRAGEVMSAALATGRALDHPFTLCFSLYFAAALGVFGGDRNATQAHAAASVQLGAEHGFGLMGAIAGVLHAWAADAQGDMKRALAAARDSGASQWRHFVLTLLAEAVWRRGRARTALAVLDQALAHCEATGERFYEPETRRLRATIHRAEGDHDAAQTELRRAAAVATAQGSVMFLRRIESA